MNRTSGRSTNRARRSQWRGSQTVWSLIAPLKDTHEVDAERERALREFATELLDADRIALASRRRWLQRELMKLVEEYTVFYSRRYHNCDSSEYAMRHVMDVLRVTLHGVTCPTESVETWLASHYQQLFYEKVNFYSSTAQSCQKTVAEAT